MNIDELRDDIWNYLFETKGAKTIEEIAALASQDASLIRAAVTHEWFSVAQDHVSIAYAASPAHGSQN